jgi:hypothetical protein
MRKPGIPAIPILDRATQQTLTAMKENIELITGARPGIGTIRPLASDATTAQIIAKINEIAARINFDGQ